jgi:hypothetical protein
MKVAGRSDVERGAHNFERDKKGSADSGKRYRGVREELGHMRHPGVPAK